MQPLSTESFEAEIRRQIEEKRAQKLKEQLLDQQLTLNHYKNYSLPGDGQYTFDIESREQQLQKMIREQGLQLPIGEVQNGVAFKGDLNQAPMFGNFQSKPVNLFDDQFLRRVNENHNFTNNLSGYSQQTDITKMSERERRIFLRDKERERRNQVQSAGIASTGAPQGEVQYGGGVALSINQKNQQDVFSNPSEQNISKRDQIWAQKAIQRQTGLSVDKQLPPSAVQPIVLTNQTPAVDTSFTSAQPNQNTSFNQNKVNYPAQKPDSTPIRSSMHALKLKQAIDLDTSVNNNQLQGELQHQNLPIGFGLSQEEKRSLQNAQRKQEYNELLQQQARKQANRDGSLTQPDPLVMGGLSQIGDHQYKQNDEKLRRQLEYKKMLEEQQSQKNQLKTPVDFHKQQLVDDVFNQVVKMKSPEQNLPSKLPVSAVGARALSAVGSNRQQEMAKLQMQETNDPFFASRNKEEVEKQRQLEKKREYAAVLQQQMLLKKAEQERALELKSKLSRQPDQRPPIHQVQSAPSYQQHAYQANQDQQRNPNFEQFQFLGSQEDQLPFPSQSQRQTENYLQTVVPSPQTHYQLPRNNKDEYRRQLEEQMKQVNDKKQKQKEEQLRYEMKNDKDLAEWISQRPEAAPSVRKGGTDITRIPKQEDEQKINARLRYQEELRQQMEEQKQRKEVLQKQAKMEDEQDEQRFMQERQKLAGRERQEIKQEGGKIDDGDKPKRQVRRDQFEPSQENPAYKPKQQVQQPVREIFINSPPNPMEVIKTPTSSALEDQNNLMLFTQPNTGYTQMPPVGRHQPFLIDEPLQQNPSAFNIQPHPQHNYNNQPSTPFSQFPQQSSQPSAQQFFNQQYNQQPAPAVTQSDWSQQQAAKMFEDQQKMIQLYQQALEQILKYRNQYFEQAMEMRENILKEREQLLEFEKLKQHQMIEMQQIKAVRQQLSSALHTSQPLSANVKQNLEQYIVQQKQQLLQMSQSQSQIQQLMSSQQPQFTVETSRVQIDQMKRDYSEERRRELMSPGAMSIGLQVAAQVDEIAEHIERIGAQQFQHEQDFEESLNSNTKLVKVPKNNLAGKAMQLKQSPMRASLNQTKEDLLLATWDEGSLEKMQQNSFSKNVSAAKQGFLNRKENGILEMPDEDKMQSPVNRKVGMSDAQFNDRDSSDERNQQRTIDSHFSRRKQLSTSGMIERKATITGSSFYDHTLKNQKHQAETQQAEMQKQLMRIFGNTQTSGGLVKVQDENREDADTPSLHEIVETIDYGERDEEVAHSDINIANTRAEIIQRLEDSQIDGSKNTSKFLNEGRASEFKFRGSREFLLAQQEMMRENPMQSCWDEPDTVPVVSQNQNLQQTQFSNQMMSEFQVQEEELLGEGTLNFLKSMNPDVLKTQGTQDAVSNGSGTMDQQLAVQLLSNSDDDMQIKDEQINEEIYSSCEEDQTQQQYTATKAAVSTSKNQNQETLSKKEREIKEIEALIRKAQATTSQALEAASRKKEQSKQKEEARQKLGSAQGASTDRSKAQPEEDTNILADLDRIINNLELQQKNMATFGIVDHYEESDQHQDEDAYQQQTINKQSRTQWKTLQEARLERPTTGKSTGKAPLVPKRLQDDMSKSKISQRLGDNSPNQRVGKFSQMALMNQTNISDQSKDRSLNSKSPQRIGKYTQMAMDTSFKSGRSQNNSVSPSQTLGKFAQMALNQNPHDLSEDDIQNISQKYSRGQSREKESNKSHASLAPIENVNAPAQASILRPVSGSHSSRYQGTKQTTMNQRPLSTVLQNQNQQLQQLSSRTPGGQTTITSHKQQQFYFSDDEENGQTEGTQQFDPPTDFGKRQQISLNHRIVHDEDQ